jgi:hypothetical protein
MNRVGLADQEVPMPVSRFALLLALGCPCHYRHRKDARGWRGQKHKLPRRRLPQRRTATRS